MNIDYFPKVVVTGEGFCNRSQERALLANYIKMGRHTWIQAHRRHGKTSLVAQCIEDLQQHHNIVYSRCHLRFASDVNSCVRKLIQSVDSLIYEVLQNHHQDDDIGTRISKYSSVLATVFRKIQPSISVQNNRPVISTTQSYDLNSLEDAFYGLNNIAKKFQYRAVLLIDEFQEIGKLNEHMEIESSIRQNVEDATNVTYIFAGSERTLMEQALSEKKRPLYKHTQPFELERISEDCYLEHLNKLAQQQWHTELQELAFKQIMYFTQRHPYYVNWLCDELWLHDSSPTEETVIEAWNRVVYLSNREDVYEVRSLSLNEKKIVIAIARGMNTKMTSANVASELKMAPSSISRALESLLNKDIIDRQMNSYYIVNPALATYAIRES